MMVERLMGSEAAGLARQHDFGAIRDHIADRHSMDVGLRVGINTGEVVIADDDADIVEDRGDWCVRLMDRYLDCADTDEGCKDRFRHCACHPKHRRSRRRQCPCIGPFHTEKCR